MCVVFSLPVQSLLVRHSPGGSDASAAEAASQPLPALQPLCVLPPVPGPHFLFCPLWLAAVSPLLFVQSFSHVWLVAIPWTAAHQEGSLSFSISWSLLELMSIESVMPSNHLILCHPLLLLLLIFPTIRVFCNESFFTSGDHKCWNFTGSPYSEYSGNNWFPLELTGLISLLSSGLSRVFSRTTVRKHQFFGTQPLVSP